MCPAGRKGRRLSDQPGGSGLLLEDWDESGSVTRVSVSLSISGNKPIPDDPGDVGGEDNSLVCRAPRQSKVSMC